MQDNLKLTIVASYFGRVPSYFQAWMDSASFNKGVKWLFYTDQNLSCFDVPTNVLVKSSSFPQMKALIRDRLHLEPAYQVPWDLCKYKVAFGKLFEEDLVDADYWGWTDCDLVYGDLSLVMEECKKGFGKVMPKGHFSILKNECDLVNGIVDHPKIRGILDATQQYVNTGCVDEEELRFEVLPELGVRQSDELPYANFYPRYGHFQLQDALPLCKRLGYDENPIPGLDLPCVFVWKDGKITGLFAMPNGEVRHEECVYVHFFKREIRMYPKRLEQGHSYLIAPNYIKEYDGHPLSWAEVAKLDRHRIHWDYFLKRLNLKTIARKIRRA